MRFKIHTAATAMIAVALLAEFGFSPAAQANVYATNIKLNGALTNIAGSPGTPVSISYILNEPATRGVVINIFAGTNIVRAINVAAGNAGTLRGTNIVAWDGKDSNSNSLAGGIYNVSITASTTGFTNWTQTSVDASAGNYVFSPRGLAVNTNPKSLYYGRVFAGNAANNPSGSKAGDVDGILKANADGSLADEGQSSGGYSWVDDSFNDSPHMLRYGQDDRIYALDFTSFGEIIALDMVMSTNQKVLSINNYSQNPFAQTIFNGTGWGTMDVTDAGKTNGLLWLGDDDTPNGAGIFVWHMTNGMADPNDFSGKQAVAVGGDLSFSPMGGFMTDESSNIFVSQSIPSPGDPRARTMEFTNWNGVAPLTNGTAWQTGASDDTMLDIYDTALDNRTNPSFVAVAMAGGEGGLRVLNASNGAVVTNAISMEVLTNLDVTNFYFGVSWDAVGNLYGANSTQQAWRVFSPPGTNQATTIAIETIQVNAPDIPKFTSITVGNNSVTLIFTAAASDAPTSFTLQNSSSVNGPYATVPSPNIIPVSPGVFRTTVPKSGSAQFFRLIH